MKNATSAAKSSLIFYHSKEVALTRNQDNAITEDFILHIRKKDFFPSPDIRQNLKNLARKQKKSLRTKNFSHSRSPESRPKTRLTAFFQRFKSNPIPFQKICTSSKEASNFCESQEEKARNTSFSQAKQLPFLKAFQNLKFRSWMTKPIALSEADKKPEKSMEENKNEKNIFSRTKNRHTCLLLP